MTEKRHWLTGRLVIGVIVIWLGTLWTLDNLDILDSEPILQFWPVAIIAFGLIRLFKASERSQRISGLAFTVLGILLLMSTSDYVDFSIFDLWPVALILFGASLIMKAIHPAGRSKREESSPGVIPPSYGAEEKAEGDNNAPSSSASRINTFTLMGATGLKSLSPNFTGGDVTALLGGAEIDLRHARAGRDRIYLDLFAFCGGIDIKVPEDWQVESEVVPIMGGIEDNSKAPAGPAQTTLVLRGGVVWGGIEVKN